VKINKIIEISFSKGGIIEVRWSRKNPELFDDITVALGFACRLRDEERGEPCILLPPNALTYLAINYDESLWQKGVKKAEEILEE